MTTNQSTYKNPNYPNYRIPLIGILIFLVVLGFIYPNLYVVGYYKVDDRYYWHTGKDWYIWDTEWKRAENPTKSEFPLGNKMFVTFDEFKKFNIEGFDETKYYPLYIDDNLVQDSNSKPLEEDCMLLNKITKEDLIEGNYYKIKDIDKRNIDTAALESIMYYELDGAVWEENTAYKFYTLMDGTEIYIQNSSKLDGKKTFKGRLQIKKQTNVDKSQELYILV